MKTIKFLFQNILLRIFILTGASVLGLLLLCSVYLLPTDNMFLHAKSSSQTISEEGVYPAKWGEQIGSTLDNFTDALMIQNAIFPSTGNLLKDTVSVNHMQYTDKMQPVEDLSAQVHDLSGGHPQEYMRYWHGYLLYLKPLLLFTDYSGIRILNGILQIVLISSLFYLMNKKGLRRFILPFFFSWLAIAPWVLPYSMQLSVMYNIALIECILLLIFFNKIQAHIYLFFMVAGILTSYFDYLTWPLITLGLPLIFYLLKKTECETLTSRKLLAHTFIICVNWGIGYGGMWIAKWIISELILQNGAISQALGAAVYRSSTDSEGADVIITPTLIWIENLRRIFNPAFCIGMFFYAFTVAADIIHCVRKKSFEINIMPAAMFLFIAAMPFIWYALLKNHSFVHLSLVYRSLWISIFAGMCFLSKIYTRNPIKTKVAK